jgi:hypothetical protein
MDYNKRLHLSLGIKTPESEYIKGASLVIPHIREQTLYTKRHLPVEFIYMIWVLLLNKKNEAIINFLNFTPRNELRSK